MSKDYLAPRAYPLQPVVTNTTGPEHHGRVIAPPDMSKFGGFVSTSVTGGPKADPAIGIKKPGGEV